MVRNVYSGQAQGEIIFGREIDCIVRAKLTAVVHGYLSREKRDFGSLIVLEFSFLPLKASRRIKSARISMRFEDTEYGLGPVVAEFRPEGVSKFEHTKTVEQVHLPRMEAGIGFVSVEINCKLEEEKSWTRESATVLHGWKTAQGRNVNIVTWQLTENHDLQGGIPHFLRTVVLLKRDNLSKFTGIMDIETDVSGLSLGRFIKGRSDDPVLFDPKSEPLGRQDLIEQINPHCLGAVDLTELVNIVTERGLFTPSDQIQETEREARETLQEVVAYLDKFEPAPTAQEVADSKDADAVKYESLFVILWNLEFEGGEWVEGKLPDPGLVRSGDNDILSKKLCHSLQKEEMLNCFQWLKAPEPNKESDKDSSLCSLIVRTSSGNGFTTYGKLRELFAQPPAEVILEFFDLPQEYAFIRRHDRGTCQLESSQGDNGKIQKGCVIQTPFYTEGFWSLVLRGVVDSNKPNTPSKMSGIIYMDKEVDALNLLEDVRKLVKKHGHHPMLLPLQLLISHHSLTTKPFNEIVTKINDVDQKILGELRTKSKPEKAADLYRSLSMTLHECSMGIAELCQRQKFEEEFGNSLRLELGNVANLFGVVDVFVKWTQSRDPVINTLPGKIESLRNMLFNLITQHDSYLQSKLAQQSLHDSKAMKTLSILTILFLPGAFIATIFSTNMFTFESTQKEISIYFAIVVPLTAVLMVGWILWLSNEADGLDVEKGNIQKMQKTE